MLRLRKRSIYTVILASLICLITVLSGCSGSSDDSTADTTQAHLVSVNVIPLESSVISGETVQFKAQGKYSDDSLEDISEQVKWSSSDISFATITDNGFATGAAEGIVMIQAELDGIIASAELTVISETSATVLTSVQLIPQNSSVLTGEKVQLKAAGTYSDGSTRDISAQVKWSSSDSAVITVDNEGLATAVSSGTASVQAEIDGIIGSAELKVNTETDAPILVSVQIMPQNLSVELEKTTQFEAVGTYKDGSTQDITSLVKWSSSNTAVVTINTDGFATAVEAGKVSIMAELDSISDSTELTVNTEFAAPVLISIQIMPQNPYIETGETTQFKATGTYKDGTTQDITDKVKWSSSNSDVVMVNTDGFATAVTAGTSLIHAELNDISTNTQTTITFPYTPQERSLISVQVMPEQRFILPGNTYQFTATGAYSDGTEEDISRQIIWSLSDAAVATVSNAGLVTAVAEGESLITATLGGISGNANLMVQSNVFNLERSGANQYLLPVKVGSQTLNLLVDTGSDALLVFEERLAPDNTQARTNADPVTITDTSVSRSYFGVTRTGVMATAPVKIGDYFAPAMKIMVIQSPDFNSDPYLTSKNADGIIGLRRTQGLSSENEYAVLDVPLIALEPAVDIFELNLPPSGQATLSLGKMPILDHSQSSYIFKAKTLSFQAVSGSSKNFTDFQIPFRAKSSFGKADGENLDVMLDTGTVSKLVLDTETARSLGYNLSTKKWEIPEDEEIEFNLIGENDAVIFYPKFKISEISVAPYLEIDSSFEAVLGIDRWQHYVIGFSCIGPDSGEPDGTLLMMFRPDIADAKDKLPGQGRNYQNLSLLNSDGNDRYPSADDSGNIIAFQSDRSGGMGGNDIYVFENKSGFLTLPELNSSDEDGAPNISGNGKLLAFHSDRTGNFNIYLYNISTKSFIDLPNGVNSDDDEQKPAISRDGTKLAFQSSRNGSSDIYLYDLTSKTFVTLGTWMNTESQESSPSLNRDGTLISFEGTNRADCFSEQCVYLYDVQAGILQQIPETVNILPRQGYTGLEPDGKFMAYTGYKNNSGDIYLLDTNCEEKVFMPGLNTLSDESMPSTTAHGKHIVFESNRPGGQGGYDIYLYQRNEADKTAYTVSSSYIQQGYVEDSEGNRPAAAQVNVYANNKNLLASAFTSENGDFSINIAAGTQLPIQYESEAGQVITDGVGNDIYVPDFEAGNLKFTQVEIQDTAQSGFPATLNFDVETTAHAYNTYIKVYLKKGSPSDIQFDEDIEADPEAYDLTATVIEELGQKGGVPETIDRTQGSINTKISYIPGTENRKVHVEQLFIVPPDIPEGTYTAVFSINVLDVNTGDDALQGEIDTSDNYMAASESTVIINPENPNLRILSASLLTNSFELPSDRSDDNVTPGSGELSLSLEVESMSMDTTEPVDIIFELEIDGVKYPMTFAESDGQGGLIKAEKQTYTLRCREQGDPPEERCASLFKHESKGKNYDLYINDDTYDVLSAKTSDTRCNLIITMDPDNAVAEYKDNKEDNVKQISIVFLKHQAQARARQSAYANTLFDYREEKAYGNDKFGVGYNIGPEFSYAENTYEDKDISVTYPYAANFDGMNELWAKVFGYEVTILGVGAEFDFNGDDVGKSYFNYGVTAVNIKVYGERLSIIEEDKDEITLWKTEKDGNERFSKSMELLKVEKTFWEYLLPIKVFASVSGEIGIKGELKFTTGNKLILEGGPYASLTGAVGAGVDALVAEASIKGEITLIELYLKLTPVAQILPSYPIAIFRFEAPILLSTLDGKLSLYARAGICPFFCAEASYTFFEWTGLTSEFHFFPALSAAFGNTEKFKAFYYDNTDWNGEVNHEWENSIDHDWGESGPSQTGADNFSAMWEGYFYFPICEYIVDASASIASGIDLKGYFGGDYTFKMDSGDDPMTLWVDQNDDGNFEDDEKVFDNDTGFHSVDKKIRFGYHKVQVEYAENSGKAKIMVGAGTESWPYPMEMEDEPNGNISEGDLNGDGRIGLEEAITALQIVANIRQGEATLSDVIFPLQIVTGVKNDLEDKKDRVLTIYFCGTSFTEDAADAEGSAFNRPELIASTFKYYDGSTEINNEEVIDSYMGLPYSWWIPALNVESKGDYYKYIVNGAGTSSGGIDLGQVDPDMGPRDWDKIKEEAINALKLVHDKHPNDKIILNLIGFSRGGVSAIDTSKSASGLDYVKTINIIAFDPVPGGFDPIGYFGDRLKLTSKVNQYIGIYAEHAKSYLFEPVIPEIESDSTKVLMVRMPGGHETMVGNQQVWGGHNRLLTNENQDYDKVGITSRVIVEQLLTSPEWGEVPIELTTGISTKEDISFLITSIWSHSYSEIANSSFTLSFGTFDPSYAILSRDHHLRISSPLPVTHSRLCFIEGKRHESEFPWLLNYDQVYFLSDRVPRIDAETWDDIQALR